MQNKRQDAVTSSLQDHSPKTIWKNIAQSNNKPMLPSLVGAELKMMLSQRCGKKHSSIIEFTKKAAISTPA